jgi:hypothetical protein
MNWLLGFTMGLLSCLVYHRVDRIRGGLDSYAYWLRSKIKHADLPPEVQAFAEEAQREFFENLGEML